MSVVPDRIVSSRQFCGRHLENDLVVAASYPADTPNSIGFGRYHATRRWKLELG